MTNAKLIRLGKKGQIVLPKNLRDSIGAKENGMLLITAENGQISINKTGRGWDSFHQVMEVINRCLHIYRFRFTIRVFSQYTSSLLL